MARLVWLASLALVWALGISTSTRAQVPIVLQAADSLARWIDVAERSPVLVTQLDELLDLRTVDSALASVRDYLAGHPEDAFALILSVRLGGVRDLLAYQDAVARAFGEPEAEPPAIPSFAHHVATLDGVLARDSMNAAAHYWMARTLVGEAMLAGAGEAAAPDRDSVEVLNRRILRHAAAAVALEPDSASYRELDALVLVGDGRLDRAAEILAHPSTVGSLVRLLVEDLRTFAPPASAEPDAVLGNFVSMTGMMSAADSEQPELAQYLDLRLSAWSTPDSLAAVEAHYLSRWPDVLFVPSEGWEGVVAAAFVPTPDGWRAVSDSAEFTSGNHEDGDVMLMLLSPEAVAKMVNRAAEQGMPEEELKRGTRVGILYMNWRLTSPGGVP